MADGGVPTWESVARDHGRFIYNVAYRLTGNDDDAQDLVQEVLVRVRKGLGTFTPGSLEGWLARITTNAFLDDVRRRRRRPVDFLPDEPDRVVPPSRAADIVHEEENLSAGVQDALRKLPADFRAVVVMCDVVGMSYVEIGEALGVPVGTVRSRIHRGRAQLRELLG
jgi:RNA polymerase sigma-70 factor (ECF subfamily)